MLRRISDRLSKIEERRDLLAETAKYVCEDLSISIRSQANITGEVYYFELKDLEYISHQYFFYVEGFKKQNNIETHLINKSKQAALMATHILSQNPIKAVKNAPDTVHLASANTWFAYVVALNLLGVDVDDVEDGIASEVQFHLRNNIANERTTILLMELLHKAYGPQTRLALRTLPAALAQRLWKAHRRKRRKIGDDAAK